ncbi:hypothetical protein JJB07_19755 [Tumebacillus sp. ITR2]|uniref:Uncharacterized protein n=1 Tax=Tumebacillus amylolyticus TaxID=2801339 RepID=A0ABS1JF15_9BACL|nr:hypothetical protein [Tumebacillus amylolyticus]MBL0388842.1 hypothetical protein [Tumebacillus amylolyticus]
MSNMSAQLQLMAIQQSTDEITYSLGELEGVKNALLAGPTDSQKWGQRLEGILTQIEKELQNIEYVTAQGVLPKSQQERDLGMKVQVAVQEISQI